MEKFKKAFRRLPDPRADNARHELLEVLFIALAATLCGAEGPSDMATFGHSKEGLLRLVLQLRHGVPSHDTFSRVFRLLDPQAFEAAFRRFMAGFAKANGLELRGVVAVDGKALRGAFERGRQSTPLHMVNVWAAEARMCLAQRKAPGRNEAAGALEVLGLLDLEGCIVTADALHCHRDFATTVLERGADYVLALKENQSKLFAAAARRYARSGARSVAERREPATHDRCEWRRATVLRDTSFAAVQKFPGVVALARITSRRRVLGTRAEPPQVRYFLLSNIFPPSGCAHRALPLGHREPAALGARCRLQRGSQPNSQRQRAREPCYPPKARPQSGPQSPRSHVPAPENQTRGVGRRLPLGHAWSYAIALLGLSHMALSLLHSPRSRVSPRTVDTRLLIEPRTKPNPKRND